MLSIHLTTYDGQCYELPMLVEWELDFTGSVPCDSMCATCLYDESMAPVLPKVNRFSAVRDGETVLTGVLDAYEIQMSKQGLLVSVEGRGMAALLLDNESEAVAYDRAVLSEVLRNHVTPYGITADTILSPAGGAYTVSAGSSQWKALRDFTHRFGGFDPYFRRDGTLVTAPLWGSGRTLRVDEKTPLLSFRQRGQRYGVISEMLIHDKLRGVKHSVVNQAFSQEGGRRRHVLYMPRSTADERRYTGEYQIAQSELEHLELTLLLPLPFAAYPGDRIALDLERLHQSGLYEVVEARCRMDGLGEMTELTLSVR